MTKVIFRKSVYDYEVLRRDIFYMLDGLGGHGIRNGMTVVIKPNLLGPAGPDAAMVTHPLVVKAVVEYVIEKGARPQVSDSPAMGTFGKVLDASGIKEALRDHDVEYKEFKESEYVTIGEPFKKVEVASDALNADFLINLAKLKSHTQMLLTLGVKNTYGCIVGLRKPEWHFRAGENRYMFARLLVEVHKAVRPDITIVDGILAMEGQGPGRSGVPREIGMLIGGDDAVSVDISICRMLGIDPFSLLTNRAALDMGMVDENMDIDGDIQKVEDFRFPEITPVVFGPKVFHGFMRRHLIRRPVCSEKDCRRCGECWRYCPAKAITLKDRGLHFDYEKCIRCYCCIEVCPHAALRAEEPVLGKTIKKVFGM